MAIELPQEVVNARNNANSLLGTAGQMQGNQLSVGDVLKQKVQDAYGQNQDIIKPLDIATQEYIASPKVAREKYQDIFNPFTREKLVTQYRGTTSLPMLSLSSILGNRMGRIDDTIGAGVRGYEAATAAKIAEANAAQSLYNSLLDEYKTMESLRQSSGVTGGDGGGEFDFSGGGDEWEIVSSDDTQAQDFIPWDQAYSPSPAYKPPVDPYAGSYSSISQPVQKASALLNQFRF